MTGFPFSLPDIQEGLHNVKISGTVYLTIEVSA